MKRFVSIFLILVLIVQYFNKLEIFMCYQVNKKYISTFLCENKSKPEMQCDGKCYMKKQLKATEENQTKLPFNVKEFQEIIFFCSSSEKASVENIVLSEVLYAQPIIAEYISPSFSIFHPPKTV